MQRLGRLASQHRTLATDRMLGNLLAFNAGAINAGGFLVVGMYTSHMTGFASTVADNLVLGNIKLVLGAVGALLSFTAGAAATAILVNWARQNHLQSEYALPLVIEAVLLLLFGLIGATFNRQTPFAVPFTVLILAFVMGLQNALVTKISSATIRTTHMTGVITDLGIELGKLIYWNRTGEPQASRVHANRVKLRLYAGLLSAFMLGGLVGASGFKYVGFVWVVPLASLLLLLSLPPLLADLRHFLKF
jgi:uncharacterized membrane protein YoaK (UPF0700 family)